jgi:thiol-disulfide isomerase/thioredoxin
MGAGAVMVVVALLMLADYDVRFQNAIADDLPAFVVNPTHSLESSGAVHDRLADLRPARRGIGTADARPSALTRAGGVHGQVLPVLGTAPEFLGTQRWFNTPGDRPLTLRELRGRVVLVDFWTYTCINCIRTLPFLKAWDARYRREGLTIVGVHTPEFPFERDAGNVRDAIGRNGLRYPVAQDNEYATWNAYGNEYWPAKYLIDARGRVRYVHFGEGDDDKTEQAIRDLLAEAGDRPGAHAPPVKAEGVSRQVTTPESYLGSARFASGRLTDGVQDFEAAAAGPPPNGIAYDGTWEISPEAARAVRDATLSLDFGAQRVFLVLGSEDRRPRPVRVLLDGRPIPASLAGPDVHDGVAIVDRQRLYRLVKLPRAGHHVLTLEVAPEVSGYAFTFG